MPVYKPDVNVAGFKSVLNPQPYTVTLDQRIWVPSLVFTRVANLPVVYTGTGCGLGS